MLPRDYLSDLNNKADFNRAKSDLLRKMAVNLCAGAAGTNRVENFLKSEVM